MTSFTKIAIVNMSTFITLGFSKWNYDYYMKIKDSSYIKQVKKDYLDYKNGVGHL